MGYIKHHAIIVTSWKMESLNEAHKSAMSLFSQVSNIVESPWNGYHSFFIAPDGSKEGWSASDIADEAREIFINWCNKQVYEDGSTSLHVIEVAYDEKGHNEIVIHKALTSIP